MGSLTSIRATLLPNSRMVAHGGFDGRTAALPAGTERAGARSPVARVAEVGRYAGRQRLIPDVSRPASNNAVAKNGCNDKGDDAGEEAQVAKRVHIKDEVAGAQQRKKKLIRERRIKKKSVGAVLVQRKEGEEKEGAEEEV